MWRPILGGSLIWGRMSGADFNMEADDARGGFQYGGRFVLHEPNFYFAIIIFGDYS